ncbi:MAG: serine hydrolase [Acidimicrobiales bacterium]
MAAALLLAASALLAACGSGAVGSGATAKSSSPAASSPAGPGSTPSDQTAAGTPTTKSSAAVAASASDPPATVAPSPPASPLPALRKYLATREGTVTLGVYDRASGATWLLAPGLREDTASIVKLQILGAELRRDQPPGAYMSPTDDILNTEMIEASDNDAATALWDSDGGATGVAAFDQAAGLDQTDPSAVTYIPGTTLPGWGLTTTSAANQLQMVKAYAYPNDLLTTASRTYALGLMRNVEAGQDWGATGGVPAGVQVALKNGWLPLAGQGWQVDSVGWILGDEHNYVLAVLDAGNPDEAYGIATIDEVSSLVYGTLASA